MNKMSVRPYRPEDREQVRRICYETGFMGESVDWFWRDRRSFADMFCGWWIDHQLESALVAELNGEVAGYLLGCEDSRLVASEAFILFRQFFGRACCLRAGTAGVMWRMVGEGILDGIRGTLPPTRVWDLRWPAHLHIDLLPECRGQGVGAQLVRAWLTSLRERSIPGCHLQTLAENKDSIGFFEAMGFERRGRLTSVPGFRTREGERIHVQLMVISFEPPFSESSV
jgi:ribosomal protein S18 acetylase RimI-like enzyme